MKKLLYIFSMYLFVGILPMLFTACSDEVKTTVIYVINEPVYMSFDEFRTARPLQPARAMEHPGKICVYSNYFFISEIDKGIHIINNSNPEKPQPTAFIELIGNIDITVVGNMLYADSYIDLVWFDISNPAAPVEVGRLPDAFCNVLPATGNNYLMTEIDNTKGVVVGWTVKSITFDEEVPYSYPIRWDGCPTCMFADMNNSWSLSASSEGDVALNGSMARFAAYGDYLYVVNDGRLKVFNLFDSEVNNVHEQYLQWNVESIFSYSEMLFFGTTTGMLIFDIVNDPGKPKYLSAVTPVLGCNPVVVQENYAYVTVRGGNACGQTESQLNVVDFSNPVQPFMLECFNMDNPYGLGIAGELLFVCDEGLKIFDASNPQRVGDNLLKHFNNINGFDVIPYNNVLILIGSDGLYQYDYSDTQNIRLLSVLRVQ
ncbi:MAG: hypothetical protein FWH23_01750 [Bacteroidales bacterium]|nr:hypothetical protein [Bacteroidales bacterium]MCL2133354.1 hypothetical protein [Bacteroidales bacterium]